MFKFLQRKSAVEASVLAALDHGPTSSFGSVKLSAKQALGVMAVFAARRVISEDVSKLPAALRKVTAEGAETAFSEHEHVLLSQIGKPPSDEDDGFTAMEWIEAIVADAAFYGFGVVHLNRVLGVAREAVPIPNGAWRLDNGQWKVRFKNGVWENVDRSDLMVLRGPQLGTNVTEAAKGYIDLARRLDQMMTGLARKAGRANGIISADSLDSQDKADTFVERIQKYFGASGEGGLMPVDLGQLHYTRLSMSPEELQQDITYSRVVTQIASAYRVQPSRLMHALTEHNNASLYASNRVHVEDCIQPWTKRFCQTFNKDVLGKKRVAEGFQCHIALHGLLQGDPEAQAKFFTAIRNVGAASPLTIANLADLPTEGISSDPSFPLLSNPNPDNGKDGKSDDQT